ncbi:SDR family oxidoreductase, partial [Listeria monocytogenes]|nr:SDR family oxidoreductase [Listeria monocytogenes]
KEVADATYSQMHNITPLNRISEPEEVADLIMYLASDKAQAMTGTTVVTDNGMILKSNIVPPQE